MKQHKFAMGKAGRGRANRLGTPAGRVVVGCAATVLFAGAAAASSRAARHISTKALEKQFPPTLITLNAKHITFTSAIQKIAAQAHVRFGYWPPMSTPPAAATKKHNFGFHRKPFWRVILDLQKRTGVAPANWGYNPSGTTINFLPRGKTLPMNQVDGAFLVEATSASLINTMRLKKNYGGKGGKTLSISMVLFIENKINVVQGGDVVLDKITGANGKPIESKSLGRANPGVWSANFRHIWNDNVLIGPSHFGKTIKTLRGHWTLVVATRMGHWTIKNVEKGAHGTKKFGGTTVAFNGLSFVGGLDPSANIVLTDPSAAKESLKNAGPPEMPKSEMLLMAIGKMALGDCVLRDKRGQSYPVNATGAQSGGRYVANLVWNAQGRWPRTAPLGPQSLTIGIPERMRVIRIPFTFHNISVP